ncbi:MAG: efflux RND transporter periplasmic adaptor subunit [Bacteroidales bacterium]|nr:efflux RND transporter periplasmic adaptor subunit [Bacteroidales bacterium]
MTKYETKVLQPEPKTYNTSFPATTCGVTEIKVYPQVEGIVTKKNYVPGTVVQKGQTLFVIDPTEYQLSVQSAEADLKVAKANLETTRLQYESNQKLFEKKIISDYVLNTSLNSYNSAQASVSQAQAQLNIARTNLGYCTVTSPVTGFIAGNEYSVGDMVSRAKYLCTVSDISQVKANFSITETDLLSLVMEYHLITGKNGMEGPNGSLVSDVLPKVKLKLKDGSIYQQEGRVTVIGAIVNQTTGTSSCEAVFDNPDGVLRSGLSANVIIPVSLDSVLSVPQTAAVRLQDQMMFYRVKQDGTVEGIICKEVYPSNDGTEYYVFEGLNVGDEVVTNGAGKLTNGQKIR